MKKRVVSLVLAMALILSLFSGCSEDSLNIAYPVAENVRTLDPQYASSSTAQLIAVNCFEGLVAVDETGEIIPAAAENYEKNGLTYRFTLRSGAVWKLSSTAEEGMSGKIPDDFAPAVTAHDFVFAFQRLADPATNAPAAWLFRSISGFPEALAGTASAEQIAVRAESDSVLTITLSYDDPDFLYKLLAPCAMPCNEEFFNACGGRYGLMTMYMLTNGPFYFSRWNTDASFRITKSDTYNGDRAAVPDTVWFYLNDTDVPDMNRKLLEGVYTAGVTANASVNIDALDGDYTATPLTDTLYSLIFNCQSTTAGVKSLRTALLAGLNRSLFETETETMAEVFLPGNLQLPDGVTGNALPVFSESDARASLSAALTELNVSDTEITILCTPAYETVLKNQMQQWQRVLGVSLAVRITAVTETELVSRVLSGDYEAAFYPLRAESDSAASFLASFTSGAADNITGYASAEYDALFTALCDAKTDAERAAAMSNATTHLAENAVYYPIYEKNSYFIYQNDISGIIRYNSNVLVYFSQTSRS